jgi:hypothetical protein
VAAFCLLFGDTERRKEVKNMVQKYHFRRYRLSQNHPFLVALITESVEKDGQKLVSGFNMTRSLTYVLSRPNKFIRIDNPRPMDDSDCFLCVDALKNKPIKYFSKPLKDWSLSEEDEKRIDEPVKQKLK